MLKNILRLNIIIFISTMIFKHLKFSYTYSTRHFFLSFFILSSKYLIYFISLLSPSFLRYIEVSNKHFSFNLGFFSFYEKRYLNLHFMTTFGQPSLSCSPYVFILVSLFFSLLFLTNKKKK